MPGIHRSVGRSLQLSGKAISTSMLMPVNTMKANAATAEKTMNPGW